MDGTHLLAISSHRVLGGLSGVEQCEMETRIASFGTKCAVPVCRGTEELKVFETHAGVVFADVFQST